jgi:tetratricopeptide (TPR) repeat protein
VNVPETFVDRERELAELRQCLRAASTHGTGWMIAVEGPSGIGKSAIINQFRAYCPELLGDGRDRFIRVHCYNEIGAANAFGPMVEALRLLHPQRRKGLMRAGAHALGQQLPELALLVPGIGPLLSAGAAVTKATIDSAAADRSSVIPHAAGVRQLVCRAILNHVHRDRPLILAIDDAHRIDSSSCAVIASLADVLDEVPIGLIVAYRPEELRGNEHFAQLLSDLDIRGAMRRLPLTGLSEQALGQYIQNRFAVRPPAEVTARLARLTGGYPIFVTQYLSLLAESASLDALSAAPYSELPTVAGSDDPMQRPAIPRTVEAVIQERIRRIDLTTRRLLEIASIQGEWFISGVVERVSGMPRDDVLRRLYTVAREYRLILPLDPPEWIKRTRSDFYTFEHTLLHRALYQQQSPQTRRDLHTEVAHALGELMDAVPGAPREFILDLASHLHLGGQMIPSASKTIDAARRLAAEGSSFTEASTLCRRALSDIRAAEPKTADTERLHVEAIELLLVVTALAWRGRPELQNDLALEELANEAITAAVRTGDLDLQARALFLRGKTLLRVKGPLSALPQLKAATELAAGVRDPATRFITTAEYGHHLAKQDMRAGMELLLAAERHYAEIPSDRRSSPIVVHIFDEVQTQLGINLFDTGDFDSAMVRLTACVRSLKGRNRLEELSGALNYLAQVRLALGQYDNAAEDIGEAIQCNERSGVDGGWYGWNLSLSAKIGAERGRAAAVLDLAERAWRETRRVWLVNIVPVVRNYTAYILIEAASGSSPGDRVKHLARADSTLSDALRESREAGLPRSEINALSQLGRIRLMQSRYDSAADYARQVITLVDHVGPMSTVRMEEVLYHAAMALRAANDPAAADLLARARDQVLNKAATIADEATRDHFLRAVPLNIMIDQALAQQGDQGGLS